MKKTFFYIVTAVMALGLAACQRLEMAAPANLLPDDPGEGKVSFDLSFTLSDAVTGTRALDGETPSVSNIFVAVFGSSHYLNEFIQAIPYTEDPSTHVKTVSVDANGQLQYVPDAAGKYKVRITLSAAESRRYVHVLANVDVSSNGYFPEFNSYEDEVMFKLKALAGDGYWQYLDFQGGINASASYRFQDLQLIRNFACVDVSVNAAGWTLRAYQVYNTPNEGLFPIVHGKNGTNYRYCDSYIVDDFETNVEMDQSFVDADPDIKTLITDRFDSTPGNEPLADEMSEGALSPQPKYVFENPLYDEDDAAFVIVKLRNSSDQDRYFRLDFRSPEDEALPLLRNYKYTLVISSVGHVGYDTPGEAALHHCMLDAYRGLDITNLRELDNHVSLLQVDYVTRVFTSPQTATLQYRYLEDASNASTAAPATSVELPEGSSIRVNSAAASTWETGGTPVSNSSPAGKYELVYDVISFPNVGADSSFFNITCRKGDGTFLQQRIRIYSFAKQALATDLELDNVSGIYDLYVTLPGNLPPVVFPLQLEIYQPGNKIGVVGAGLDMDVVKENGQDVFHYYQRVTYEEYQQNATVHFTFRPVKEILPTDVFYLFDRPVENRDPYFHRKEISFSGNVVGVLADNLKVINASGTPNPLNLGLDKAVTVTFDYLGPIGEPVTVTLTNLEPAAGETSLSGGTGGVYTFRPSQQECTLNLKTTTRFTPCAVLLQQTGFADIYSGNVVRPDRLVIPGYRNTGVDGGGLLMGLSTNGYVRPDEWLVFGTVYNSTSFLREYLIWDPNKSTAPSLPLIGTGVVSGTETYQHTRFRTNSYESHPYSNQEELRVDLKRYGYDNLETGRIYLTFYGAMSNGSSGQGAWKASATLADLQDCIELRSTDTGNTNYYVLLTWDYDTTPAPAGCQILQAVSSNGGTTYSFVRQ